MLAPGADMTGRRVEASESDSDSEAVASSSEASSISRASDACAIGDELGNDRLRDATLSPMFAIDLGGVGIVSSLHRCLFKMVRSSRQH